jgi:dihydrofolate reductase
MSRPILSLIAAVARRRAIGKGNALLWTERADQQHFRRVTMGCPVIMGRKTWDSLPERFRPLPGRRNIVITRRRDWQAQGAEKAASLEAALALVAGAPKVFVIGGAQVYALALPLADELVLTEIDADFDADAFFPAWKTGEFLPTDAQDHVAADGTPFRFVTYRRNPGD